MKRVLILPTFIFCTSVAFADSTSFDLTVKPKSAERLIYKERYKQVIKKLKNSIDEEPGNADAWNLLGYASRKKGDLELSVSAYCKALSIDPDHKDAQEYHAELFLKQGDKTAAAGNLAKLTSLRSNGCEQLHELTQTIAQNSQFLFTN